MQVKFHYDASMIADRMNNIAPFHVMDILARARQLEADGRDIVHMEIGEPDFVTLPEIIQSGQQALADGHVHYTPAVGLAALREEIASYYDDAYQTSIDANQIVITPGASGALQLALGVLLNAGDSVMLADPGYPCNRHMVAMYGGAIQAIPVTSESDFQLTPGLVEENWQADTKIVMLASPSNPTGTLVSRENLQEIVRIARDNGAVVIVDEIYHGLVYEEATSTAANMADNVIVINSFSKYFGMTGWRVGWLVASHQYIDAIDRLAQNIFLATSTPAQHAALTALSKQIRPKLDARREEFQQRRDYLVPALKELGFKIESKPAGAFYIYADCSTFTKDSMTFTRDLLSQSGVALTPGADFGSYQADSYVRFAYTISLDRLQEGVDRLRCALSD